MPQGRDTRFDPRRSGGRERIVSSVHTDFADDVGAEEHTAEVHQVGDRFGATARGFTHLGYLNHSGGSGRKPVPNNEAHFPLTYRTELRAKIAAQNLGDHISDRSSDGGDHHEYAMKYRTRTGNNPDDNMRKAD